MVRFLLLAFAALTLACAPVAAAAQTATPRINPLTGKPYSAAGQAEYERKQREAEEQSRMAEEAAAQDNKAFEELRARNAEQIRQFDEAIETWKDTTPPPPGTVETFVSTSYDNETALGERAEITFYNKYDVPTHKVQFGPDGRPTGPVTLTQQGKVWETIGPRIPPGGGVETSYGEDFEGNRIITRARIFTAGGKSIGDYKFNFDGVPWWGETRDPETGLINGGFMDERLKPPEATLGGPLPFPSQIRLITGVCEPCRALMEKHNSLALDINEIIIEMKSLSQEHQRAWPPAQRPIRARHAVLSARLAELMPQMVALQAEVIECDKRCRPAAPEPPPTVAALPGQPLLRPPAGIGARPTAPEKTYRPGLDAFPADDADLRAVAEAAQRYLAAAELCETMLCPVCDCEEAKASAQALADMEAYLEAMLPYLRAANDAHMERFTTTARNNITNGEQLERTIWAVGVHTYLQNFGSSLLDVASIAGWLRDIVTAERGLDELSPVEMLDQLNSAYEALKDLESLTATIAEAQTGQPQDTPVADLVELAAGADKAFINDATSYITDLKDIVTNAVEHGRDWRAALKAGAGPALGQIVGRILKTYSAAVLEERKGVLDDLLNNAAVGDLQQAREFLELQRVQNRRWAAEDALAAVRAARRRYMACVHEACGSFSLTRANIPTFRADVPGGKPKLSWGSALPWFNRAIDETLPLMKPVAFRSECPDETAEPPRTQPPPQSEPLDDGPDLSRPSFEWVSELVIPKQFCSEYARNDYIVQVYNPAIQAALRDAALAQNHLAMLNALFTQHMRTNSPYWGQVRAERDAYDLIAQAATARAEALRGRYADVIAVPLGPCDDPQPPASPQPPPVEDAIPSSPPPAARPAADDAASTPKKPCPPKQGRDPIVVGPNSRVGSGAQLRSKVGGMALGALAGALGAGGGGGGGGSDGPQLWTCKIKDSEYTIFNDPVTGVSLGVAARTVKGGKMVLFSKIMKSPDKGTFQTAFLERPSTGQTIAPSDVGPCDLWGEWKLTVSWTRSTYVDGQLVSQESGGWSEGGLFRIPGMLSKVDAPDGLWKRMGFSNASNGAREMGAIFDVQPSGEPLTLVVHVTRPKGDPVTTVPFVLTLTQGADGKIGFTKAEEEPCPEETVATSVINIADTPPPAAAASTPAPTQTAPATTAPPLGTPENPHRIYDLRQVINDRQHYEEMWRRAVGSLDDLRCHGPQVWGAYRDGLLARLEDDLDVLSGYKGEGPMDAPIDSSLAGLRAFLAGQLTTVRAMPAPGAPGGQTPPPAESCPDAPPESLLDDVEEVPPLLTGGTGIASDTPASGPSRPASTPPPGDEPPESILDEIDEGPPVLTGGTGIASDRPGAPATAPRAPATSPPATSTATPAPAGSGATTTRPMPQPILPPWGPGPKPYDPRSDPEFGKLHTAGLLRLVDGLEKMRAEDIAQRRELDRARCEGPKAWNEKREAYLKDLRGRLDIMERIVGLGKDKAAIESAAAGEVVRLGGEIAEVEAMSPPEEPQSCPVTPVPEESESILDSIEEVLVPA